MADAAGMSGRLLSECGLPSSQVAKLLSADFTTTDDVKDMKPSELSQGKYTFNKCEIHIFSICLGIYILQ